MWRLLLLGCAQVAVAQQTTEHAIALEQSGQYAEAAAVWQLTEAAAEFAQELRLEPTHVQALAYLGDVALKQSRWSDAQHDLELAAAQPNQLEIVSLDLGVVEERAGEMAKAEQALRRAAQLKPSDPEPHWRLAHLLQAAGRRDEAKGKLAKVRELHASKDQPLVQQLTVSPGGLTR